MQALVRMGFGAVLVCAVMGCRPETRAVFQPGSFASEVPASAAGAATSVGGAGVSASAPVAPLPPSASGPVSGAAPVPVAGAGGMIASAGSSAVAGAAGHAGEGVKGAAGMTPSAAGNGAGAGVGTAGILPCEVSKALERNCWSCHGSTPIGGAPMPLVTYADLLKPAVRNPTLKVSAIVKQRLNDKAAPMPPGAEISAADFTTLDAWLGAGAPAGTAADAKCETTTDTDTPPRLYPGLTPLPGETCYEFQVHGGQTADDATRYAIAQGEHYTSFYYKAPWPDGTIATRYGSKLDNVKVLHHWLLFQTVEDKADGSHVVTPLPTLNGVQAQLLAGWAVGGEDLAMPEDVGFELPPKGAQLNIQWHFYNSTSTQQTDRSAIQICTMPAGTRKHTSSVTWIGTEDLGGTKWTGGAGMPPHQTSTFKGTCIPARKGLTATEPVHIVGFWPHMHQLGTRMQTYVNHADGTRELIFDKPFDFNHQVHYLQSYDLMPGDSLTAVCHFNNTTDVGVPFGESSDTEMCYQFTFAYPAHALENNVASLIGATNTCWCGLSDLFRPECW